MQVCPQYAAAYTGNGMYKMMVIDPVNTQVNKTKQVAEKNGYQWFYYIPVCTVRYFQFQYHNGDNDGNNAVAECFKPCFGHAAIYIVWIKQKHLAIAHKKDRQSMPALYFK